MEWLWKCELLRPVCSSVGVGQGLKYVAASFTETIKVGRRVRPILCVFRASLMPGGHSLFVKFMLHVASAG